MMRLLELRRQVAVLEAELHLDVKSIPPPAMLSDASAYALVAELSSDLISIHTATGEYVFVSPNAKGFCGFERGALLGSSAYAYFHPDDLARIAADHAAHARGAVQAVRYRLRQADDSYRWVETRSRAFLTKDGVSQIVCLTRDIHEQELARALSEESERRHLQELERIARVDPLTGLANRRWADEFLTLEIARARRHGLPLSVVMLDLDHFKRINDRAGHQVGDRVLCAVSALLQSGIRGEDLAVRWGGEEFLIVLPLAPLELATACASRLLAAVQSHTDPEAGAVTASAGVAQLDDNGKESLIRRADEALYAAKQAGRARVMIDGQ